jgi:hypothetical protein
MHFLEIIRLLTLVNFVELFPSLKAWYRQYLLQKVFLGSLPAMISMTICCTLSNSLHILPCVGIGQPSSSPANTLVAMIKHHSNRLNMKTVFRLLTGKMTRTKATAEWPVSHVRIHSCSENKCLHANYYTDLITCILINAILIYLICYLIFIFTNIF